MLLKYSQKNIFEVISNLVVWTNFYLLYMAKNQVQSKGKLACF